VSALLDPPREQMKPHELGNLRVRKQVAVRPRNQKIERKKARRIQQFLRRRLLWVEDHAELAVATLAGTVVMAGGGLLVWQWPLAVSLLPLVGALVPIAAFIITGAAALLRWLKGRRSNRQSVTPGQLAESSLSPITPPTRDGEERNPRSGART
jgi:hypothetical protein